MKPLYKEGQKVIYTDREYIVHKIIEKKSPWKSPVSSSDDKIVLYDLKDNKGNFVSDIDERKVYAL